MPTDTVTISRARYTELVSNEALLQALHAAGVDNWDGYEEAVQSLEETEE